MKCRVKIISTGGGISDGVVSGGAIIGTTLVLSTTTGGTVNVPLSGVEVAINFSALSPIQQEALTQSIDPNSMTPTQIQDLNIALRGEEVQDAFGNPQGYLLQV